MDTNPSLIVHYTLSEPGCTLASGKSAASGTCTSRVVALLTHSVATQAGTDKYAAEMQLQRDLLQQLVQLCVNSPMPMHYIIAA